MRASPIANRRRRFVLPAVLVLLTAFTLQFFPSSAQPTADAATPVSAVVGPVDPPLPVMTFSALGPLRLGMTVHDALATRWLAPPLGCWVPCDGRDPHYGLDGAAAPASLTGEAYFQNDRLVIVEVRAGARTAEGIRPGVSTSSDVFRVYGSAYTLKWYYQIGYGWEIDISPKAGGRNILEVMLNQTTWVVTALDLPHTPID